MIKEHCFEKEYIRNLRKVYKKANPVFVEKTIYAFELLSLLIKSGMDFVFKGGTSLLLLLPEPKRLSIDIDIVGEIDVSKLDLIIESTKFTKIEPDIRKNDKACIKHFKFYYNSAFEKQQDSNVLLDIVLKKYNYENTQFKLLKTPFFETNADIKIKLPFINSILGDKLTAFAPNTIGIPFDEQSAARKTGILKQLFDISNLFDYADNLHEITSSYKNIHSFECEIRGTDFDLEESLNDSIDTSFLICQSGLKGSISNNQLAMLRSGCRNLINYLLKETFSLDLAKIPAAKTAFISSAILHNLKIELNKIRFVSGKIIEIKDFEITGKYKILNRLKKILPEAFYYWFLISQIEKNKSII
ncbi:MAG: nucleotidyl transferase AbiEii/AbiGii toxin family protein [Candidatus Cloacimonetes bacterium]|nr:nucleotidyl transferase AbiEii/AbiGii toxin family protein [Candidatus Cloacimonadota bacterium]